VNTASYKLSVISYQVPPPARFFFRVVSCPVDLRGFLRGRFNKGCPVQFILSSVSYLFSPDSGVFVERNFLPRRPYVLKKNLPSFTTAEARSLQEKC
jgi:hypothetical protein